MTKAEFLEWSEEVEEEIRIIWRGSFGDKEDRSLEYILGTIRGKAIELISQSRFKGETTKEHLKCPLASDVAFRGCISGCAWWDAVEKRCIVWSFLALAQESIREEKIVNMQAK